MIVRDDATRLHRCLESAKQVAEKIIVVDTGSVDESINVAKRFGAEVISIDWPDAFDEARNVGFDRVETEWTLWLDSDEWIQPESIPLFMEIISRDNVDIVRMFRQDYKEDGRFTELFLLRLWRTSPSARAVGTIHENLSSEFVEKATLAGKIINSEIRIGHDGYVGEQSNEKVKRNLRMLRKELELRPNSLYHRAYLIASLRQLEDPDTQKEVRKFIDEILSAYPDVPTQNTVHFAVASALALTEQTEYFSHKTELLIRAAWEWYAFFPSVVTEIAALEHKRGNLWRCYNALCLLEEFSATKNYNRYTSFSPALLEESLWNNLGHTAALIGNTKVASTYLTKYLQKFPYDEKAKKVLSNL